MKPRISHRRAAFTLLEVAIAVMIIGLTSMGIFRFVQSTLRAIAFSVEDTESQLEVERLVALVQEELYSLPARGQATLLGEPLKTGGINFDSMEWRSRGGSGLLTTAASGEYRVKVRIQPLKDNESKYEIGFWRRPALLDTAGGLVQGGSDKDATWVPLIKNAKSLTLRYWDARLGQMIDSWRDQGSRPTFVMIGVEREGDEFPYEAWLTVPSAQTQQQ